MKLVGLTTRVVEFDAAPRYNGDPVPAGRPQRYRYPLVLLHSDEGPVGASMGYSPHGESAALVATAHEVFWPDLAGCDPAPVERLWQQLHRRSRHLYSYSDGPVGMLDVALWDLRGQATGLSVADLLGRYRDTVPSYRTSWLVGADAGQLAKEAVETRDSGMHGYKLQLRDGPARDIPRLRAVREAVGDGFDLMHDGVAGYTVPEAMRVGRALAELDYAWFEEPIRDRDLSLLAELSRALPVPVLAGETVTLDELGEFLRRAAVPLVRGDVYLKAGITGLRKAMVAAEVLGVNLEIHAANSPLLDVANLHVAGAARNCRYIETHHPVFRFGLLDEPLTPDSAGMLTVPTGPGLGVQLDWDWLDAHTVHEQTSRLP